MDELPQKLTLEIFHQTLDRLMDHVQAGRFKKLLNLEPNTTVDGRMELDTPWCSFINNEDGSMISIERVSLRHAVNPPSLLQVYVREESGDDNLIRDNVLRSIIEKGDMDNFYTIVLHTVDSLDRELEDRQNKEVQELAQEFTPFFKKMGGIKRP